jgi:DNA-binding NarL/FixJ family response regulator
MRSEAISVLLVDDNRSFLHAEERFLKQTDEVEIVGKATNAAEAVSMVKRMKPEIVLLDIAMPEITGIDLVPELREARPSMGIIALTVMDTDSYREAALAAGADAFLSKSVLFTDLLPTIQYIASKRKAGLC